MVLVHGPVGERLSVEGVAGERELLGVLPRSQDVQRAEELERTVIEAFPDSEMAARYRDLAERVLAACQEDAPC